MNPRSQDSWENVAGIGASKKTEPDEKTNPAVDAQVFENVTLLSHGRKETGSLSQTTEIMAPVVVRCSRARTVFRMALVLEGNPAYNFLIG